MKKILFALTFLAFILFANAANTVNEKVLTAFGHVFPEVKNARWSEAGNFYEAYFDAGDVKCRARFDAEGKMICTTRYYGEKTAAPFLKAKLTAKFPGKTIFGVTEVCSDEELVYYVILEDAKNWTTVKADASGATVVIEKFKKA